MTVRRSTNVVEGTALFVLWCACCALGCGSSSPSGTGSGPTDGGATAHDDAGATGATSITETGTMLDYESLQPVAGLTVTDNGASTTTDAHGEFTLLLPGTATLLSPKVTGPKYSTLLFPESSPAGSTVSFGTVVIPDSSTYELEQAILRNDQTLGLVHVIVRTSGACTSAAGGTLQVLSPPGASVAYFSTLNIPDMHTTSFQAVESPRPVAVLYNVPIGAQISLGVTHPTCTVIPFPATDTGKVLNGKVSTVGAEPNDVNGAIALLLQ